jgi:hypothetical protein
MPVSGIQFLYFVILSVRRSFNEDGSLTQDLVFNLSFRVNAENLSYIYDIEHIFFICSIFYITIHTARTASPIAAASSTSAAGIPPIARIAAFRAAYPP